MRGYCIIVTGVPASGKTTAATDMARQLDIPLVDNDDFLANLFELRGTANSGWRHKLSGKADHDFISESRKLFRAVLVSHWRPRKLQVCVGTPVDWIEDMLDTIIELQCHCPINIAALRFKWRLRHTGHNDQAKLYLTLRNG